MHHAFWKKRPLVWQRAYCPNIYTMLRVMLWPTLKTLAGQRFRRMTAVEIYFDIFFFIIQVRLLIWYCSLETRLSRRKRWFILITILRLPLYFEMVWIVVLIYLKCWFEMIEICAFKECEKCKKCKCAIIHFHLWFSLVFRNGWNRIFLSNSHSVYSYFFLDRCATEVILLKIRKV